MPVTEDPIGAGLNGPADGPAEGTADGVIGGATAGLAGLGGAAAAAVGGFHRRVSDWPAARSLAPTSLSGVGLVLGICAAAWFTAGTRPDNLKGALALGVGYVAALGAREFAGQRPGVARSRWLDMLATRLSDCVVYAGLAVGAIAQGWTGMWPLAIAVLSLVAIRDTMTACGRPAGSRSAGSGSAGSGSRRRDETRSGPDDDGSPSDGRVYRAIVAVLTMPAGGRVLLIVVAAPIWGARASLLGLLDWAIIAVGYGIGGTTAGRRDKGRRDKERRDKERRDKERRRAKKPRRRAAPAQAEPGALAVVLRPVRPAEGTEIQAGRPGGQSIPVLRLELSPPPPGFARPARTERAGIQPGSTSRADAGFADNGYADAGAADHGPADAGFADDGRADNGYADAGAADHGRADNAYADAGAADAGFADHGPAGAGFADHGFAGHGRADHGLAGIGLADPEPAGAGYADHGYADAGFADHGYAEAGFADDGLAGTGLADADTELADPELADPELADTELADTELADPELADPELADSGRRPGGQAGGRPAAASRREPGPPAVLRCRDDGAISRWFGRLVRGQLMPLPAALLALAAVATLAHLGLRDLPGLLILAPAIVMLVAAPGSSHPHAGRFDWLVPAVLQGAQYIYIAALGFAAGVPAPLTFVLCAAIALRYADLDSEGSPVLPARPGPARPVSLAPGQSTPDQPAPERGTWMGWEGRMIICGLGAAMGVAMFAYAVLAAYVGGLVCRKIMTSRLGLREGECR